MSFVGFEDCNNCEGWNIKKKACEKCERCNDSRVIETKVSYNGNNKSNFNALPGGFRNSSGEFYLKGLAGYWWIIYSNDNAIPEHRSKYWCLKYDDKQINDTHNYKSFGYSVRCIKE